MSFGEVGSIVFNVELFSWYVPEVHRDGGPPTATASLIKTKRGRGREIVARN
jgi:hypothetical protein